MIQGNVLSYKSAETSWYTFSLSGTVLASLLTSVLVTMISYQAAAMVFDFLLGMKKRKQTKVKMLGVLMLAWKTSSPLTLLNSILRLNWITRLYYKSDIPKDTHIARDRNGVKVSTAVIVILLVLATPIIDIIFVALTLSKSRSLSFSEAGFGGVQLGLREDLTVLDTVPYLTSCKLARFEGRRNDVIDARLSICALPTLPEDPRGDLTGVEFVQSGGFVQIIVIIRGIAAVSSSFSELQTSDGSFLIKPGLTSSSMAPLFELAKEALAAECGEMREIGPIPSPTNGSVLSRSFTCGQASTSNSDSPETQIANLLQEKLTLIPSDKFLVTPLKDIESRNVIDASKLNFLERNEPTASTFILICVAAAILIGRVVASFLLSNDVGDGLEYIVKNRLGLRECDSMFWIGQEQLYFRRKFQSGDEAHLGLHREGISEVESFRGGNLGGHGPVFDKA